MLMAFGTVSLVLAMKHFQAAFLPAGSHGGACTGLRETPGAGAWLDWCWGEAEL